MATSAGPCFEWKTGPKITTPTESGKAVTFNNPDGQRVLFVHADKRCRKGRAGCTDCFFEPDQKVADFIVCKPGLVDVIVELKGGKVITAVEQIEQTFSVWRLHRLCSGKIGALIVSSQGASHPLMLTKLQKRQEQFQKRGIRLIHVAAKGQAFEFASFCLGNQP
jgi:hypothetical protein